MVRRTGQRGDNGDIGGGTTLVAAMGGEQVRSDGGGMRDVVHRAMAWCQEGRRAKEGEEGRRGWLVGLGRKRGERKEREEKREKEREERKGKMKKKIKRKGRARPDSF